jgi:hypothetical protein
MLPKGLDLMYILNQLAFGNQILGKGKEKAMARTWGTKVDGSGFDEATIEAVWGKATSIPGYTTIKKDSCGAMIQRDKHGKTGTYGWEIDHDKPLSKGGTDDLSNLKPLQWENNRHKADNWPNWECKIRN